jgi:hypothetical protein
MNIDTQDLIDAVQANLTPDLLSPQERARLAPGDHFTTGHCAVAAEALLHLVRRYRTDLTAKPICATYRETPTGPQPWLKGHHRPEDRRTHWYVLSSPKRARYTWVILDPTREQYTAHGLQPPYYLGKGRGFQGRRSAHTGLQMPTKRARILIDRAVAYLKTK